MARSFSGFVVAGTHSGVGKTTVTLGILAALRERGLSVQPFKIGPDFIDPGLHRSVSGIPAYNLDGWIVSRARNHRSFLVNTRQTDVAVIEGMMGLFDGFDGTSEAGSTAEMAKWLDLPVVLIVDASAMARSVAALVLGYRTFDSKLNLVGVIFNRVAGERHLRYLKDALASVPDVECFGGIPHTSGLHIPERHLGILTAEEGAAHERLVNLLPRSIDRHVDLTRLLKKTRISRRAISAEVPSVVRRRGPVRIGVARDEAFCFYYEDNLNLLEAAGAELLPVSLIHDRTLPKKIDGLYLGGGYPELYARELSQNRTMLNAVRAFVESGGPVYAECGGLMYLAEQLIDIHVRAYPMAGVYPFTVEMRPHLSAIDYHEITVVRDTIFPRETVARGHEFHHSAIRRTFPPRGIRIRNVYTAPSANKRAAPKGYAYKNCLASYVHLHFASNLGLAESFVEKCQRSAS